MSDVRSIVLRGGGGGGQWYIENVRVYVRDCVWVRVCAGKFVHANFTY